MKTIKNFLALFSTIILISCGGGSGGDPTPTDPKISVSNTSINEGDNGITELIFTISLNQIISGNSVNVSYATSDGTATAGADYTATNGIATISAGSTSTTMTVSVIGDTVNEDDESLTLTLSNAVGATLGTSVATGVITNDDAPIIPSISINNPNVAEGDSGTTDLIFTISLSQAASGLIDVDYSTSDDTAIAGADYTATNGTTTISAGGTSTTVTVSVSGDTNNESDETLTLTLSNAIGATLATASATGTIINDDAISASGGPYMLYGDTANMYAVDASDPTQTHLIGSPPPVEYEASMLLTGDLNVGNSGLNNIRPDSFVYYSANKFWRLDLSTGSNLIPVQISSADIGYVCEMEILENIVTPSDSYIFYVTAANSSDCFRNSQAYRIQVGDDSSVVPISISGAPYLSVETIETGMTPGQVTGFLVRNSTDYTVKKYDANFSNPVTLLDGSTRAIPLDGSNGFVGNVSFYLVDDVLYSYTHDAVSAVEMHIITTGSSFDYIEDEEFSCNATNCYFVEVDDGSGVQSLHMVAVNGSGSAQVGTAFTNDEILGLTQTSGRLYITTKSTGGGQSLYALSLPSGTPEVVDSLSGSDYFSRLMAMGDLLYYTSINFSADSISAIVRKDNNSVPVGPIVDAAWAGFVFSNVPLNPTSFVLSKLILAEEVTTPTIGVKYTAYETATATAGTVLGTLADSFVGKGFGAGSWGGTYLLGVGTSIMGGAFFGTPSTNQWDVFFADTAMADSLYRVTNSSTLNEGPLF